MKRSQSCVDHSSLILMASGQLKPLKDIQLGDVVMSPPVKKGLGRKVRVIGKDIGQQIVPNQHIRIKAGNHELVVSMDHLMSGHPAEDYRVMDLIRMRYGEDEVVQVTKANPEFTGDLLLENGGGYYANGFAVDSMLARAGVTVKQLDEFHAMMAE